MTIELEEYHIALTGGTWQPGRWGVLRWAPTPPEPIFSVHDLIACPTCHARVDETCRTKRGNRTTPHGSRITPRLCPCGKSLQPQRRMCSPCVKETSLANKRAWNARRRAARETEKVAA